MNDDGAHHYHTRQALAADLAALGLKAGDTVMVHAAMRKIGPVLNGPDAFINAILDVVGPEGTLMAYADWDTTHDDFCDDEGKVAAEWRSHVPPFDLARSRANRDYGVLAEFVRTTPGACRSANPGASMVALGAKAQWLTADHPLDYGYGEGSPLARLAGCDGKVLLAGAPRDTMSLLHHAEHLADIPGKHIRRIETPIATERGVIWRMIEEFDTSDPVVDGLKADYFGTIVSEFLAGGQGATGKIGNADSVLVSAPDIVEFAVRWLERHCPSS